MPHLKKIVKYIPETEELLEAEMREAGVINWEEFMEAGKVRERERGGKRRDRGRKREREGEREAKLLYITHTHTHTHIRI